MINGRIIIEYKTNLENQKYVCVIGSVDPNNFLIINEYALIYNEYKDYYSHISSLKNKLNNFLQGLQLFNGTQPIIDSSYREIGTLIEIQQVGGKPPIIQQPDPYPKDSITIPPEPMPNPSYDPEYNLDSNLNITSIKQYFTAPLLIGLDNIGATCYMNATLQCFCNIEKFVNYFKYNKYLINFVRNDTYKQKLSSAFKLLTEKLWPDTYMNQTHYAPYNFKELISSMNPLFKGVAANDSKDLVNFIIMTLHEELNKVKDNNMNMNANNFASFVDQRNQLLMLNNFMENFKATNRSIVSDLFYGVNCGMTQCSSCNSLSYNYQTYFFLVFPLEEVRKYKFSNLFNNNEVNIYDCF